MLFTAIPSFYAGLQTLLLVALMKHLTELQVLFVLICLSYFTFPQVYQYTQPHYSSSGFTENKKKPRKY